MVTQLNINEALIQEVLALDDQTTIESMVETALREYSVSQVSEGQKHLMNNWLKPIA